MQTYLPCHLQQCGRERRGSELVMSMRGRGAFAALLALRNAAYATQMMMACTLPTRAHVCTYTVTIVSYHTTTHVTNHTSLRPPHQHPHKQLSLTSSQRLVKVSTSVIQCAKLHTPAITPKQWEDIDALTKKFHIQFLEDWYDVPKSHIRLFGEAHNLWNTYLFTTDSYRSVEAMVKAFYPNHTWEHNRFLTHSTKTLSSEIFMRRVVLSIFKDKKMEYNCRTHGIMGDNGLPLEIDVYIPSLKLGFEYQDPHHYFHIRTYGTSTLEEDNIKLQRAKALGITIVNIPFWWDWDANSLIATVKHLRPELLKTVQVPANTPIITSIPPQHIKENWDFQIPGLGMPMLALEAPRKQSFNPDNWLIFEKFDGIRAVWNAEERQLYSRWGKELSLPNFISDTLSARDWFDVNWDKFRYVIFDCPSPEMREEKYVDRYKKLEAIFSTGNSYLELATYDVCTGKEFAEVVSITHGGEGIILRDPNGAYINGYSRFIYKYKGFNDAEALVLKKLDDNKYLCRVNNLHMQHNAREDLEGKEEDGAESEEFFDVEMTLDEDLFDDDVELLQESTFVSFKYVGQYAKGLAVNLVDCKKIYSIRNDIQNWDQILSSKRKPPASNQIWKKAEYSTWTEKASRRKFFDNIAQANNFDPLNPDNWYTLDSKEILKEGSGMLWKYYQNSHFKALMDVYPELEWKETNFQRVPKHHWESKENRQQFFNDIAKEKGFDPHVASNWYPISREDVLTFKGGNGVLKKYNHSLTNALIDAYPFVEFDKTKFLSQLPITDPEKQKSFFTQLAQKRNFDALKPQNWYSIHSDDVADERGGKLLLRLYRESLPLALATVFPKIKFDKTKFTTKKITKVVQKR